MLREVYAMAISKEAMLKLQNGSDVRGVAVAGVEGQPVTLTPETAQLIARAFVRWLAEKSKKSPEELKIGVGHDSRISARQLEEDGQHGQNFSASFESADRAAASFPARRSWSRFVPSRETTAASSPLNSAQKRRYGRRWSSFSISGVS